MVVLSTLGCGSEPDVSRADVDALLQRLDAMDARLDALEDARAAPPRAPAAPLADGPAQPGTEASPLKAVAEATATATLTIHVTRGGGLEIDGEAVTRQQAQARFREAARAPSPPRLSVLAEPEAPHSAVIDAIDLASEAGLPDVAMSARIHREGEAADPP